MWFYLLNLIFRLSVLESCDGVILTTSESYEPEAVTVVKDWFAETSRSVFVLGPLLPTTHDPRALAGEKQTSAKAKEIDLFMESTLASHGKGSMLYVWAPYLILPKY